MCLEGRRDEWEPERDGEGRRSHQFPVLLCEAGGQRLHVRVLQGLPAQLVGLHVNHPAPVWRAHTETSLVHVWAPRHTGVRQEPSARRGKGLSLAQVTDSYQLQAKEKEQIFVGKGRRPVLRAGS